MKLPGTFESLTKQLRKVGLGDPTEMDFDADGNITHIGFGPARRAEVVPTAAKAQNVEARAKAAAAQTQTAISSLRAVPPSSIFEDDNTMGRRG